MTLQILYLADHPAEAEDLFARQAIEILTTAPTTAPYLLAIHEQILGGNLYQALKRGRDLVRYERVLRDARSDLKNVALSAAIHHRSQAVA